MSWSLSCKLAYTTVLRESMDRWLGVREAGTRATSFKGLTASWGSQRNRSMWSSRLAAVTNHFMSGENRRW